MNVTEKDLVKKIAELAESKKVFLKINNDISVLETKKKELMDKRINLLRQNSCNRLKFLNELGLEKEKVQAKLLEELNIRKESNAKLQEVQEFCVPVMSFQQKQSMY